MIFQETDGDITFKDTNGNTYSFSRKDYKYFKEKERFYISEKKKKKDTLSIKQRKINQFEFSCGLRPYQHFFETIEIPLDAVYISRKKATYEFDLPLSVHFEFGKYFNRRHYLGLSADYGILTSEIVTNYLSYGVKYKYQYDAYKHNTLTYLFAQLSNSRLEGFFSSYKKDVFNNIYIASRSTKMTMEYPEISLGHGFMLMLKNKRAVGIELSMFRALKQIEPVYELAPPSDFPILRKQIFGVSGSLIFNL
ncbi:MAG: hypothetical protein IPL35_01265 [Sphingobacteriales bacterium]|nr:hypothetical protein [Sphingobacteriales bacterium]